MNETPWAVVVQFLRNMFILLISVGKEFKHFEWPVINFTFKTGEEHLLSFFFGERSPSMTGWHFLGVIVNNLSMELLDLLKDISSLQSLLLC